MTPAIKQLEAAGVDHELRQYNADSIDADYGHKAASQLGLSPAQVFKTLVAETDAGTLVVAIVPVSGQLNLKRLASSLGAKKAVMANRARVEKTTGYVLGGVSPLGQKKQLRTVIDTSARDFARVHVSGGRRGLEISLTPADLARLTAADFAAIADNLD